MTHQHVLSAMVAIAAWGCSGEPRSAGQPYGAGTNARDDGDGPEMNDPDAGPATGGTGGASGTGGLSGVGGAAGAEAIPQCEMLQPAPIGVCVVLPDPAAGERVSMSGVVQSVLPASAPLCEDRALGDMVQSDGTPIYEIVVSDGQSEVRVQLRVRWRRPSLTEGDAVTVEYKAELPKSSVGHGDFTVRDAGGGLLIWVAQAAHGFDSVQVPELIVSDGQDTCSVEDSCGTATHGSIHAFDRTDEVSIGYGDFALVGDLAVLHGDNTELTSDGACGDMSSYHRVVVAALRVGEQPLGIQ